MPTDKQAIREANRVWIEAVNKGDLALLLRSMTEDAVFITPWQGPLDRERFQCGFAEAMQRSRVACVSELEELTVVGDMAYSVCRDTVSATSIAGGDTARFAGHRLTIWRKQPDGRWLLARDMNTLTAVATSETMG